MVSGILRRPARDSVLSDLAAEQYYMQIMPGSDIQPDKPGLPSGYFAVSKADQLPAANCTRQEGLRVLRPMNPMHMKAAMGSYRKEYHNIASRSVNYRESRDNLWPGSRPNRVEQEGS